MTFQGQAWALWGLQGVMRLRNRSFRSLSVCVTADRSATTLAFLRPNKRWLLYISPTPSSPLSVAYLRPPSVSMSEDSDNRNAHRLPRVIDTQAFMEIPPPSESEAGFQPTEARPREATVNQQAYALLSLNPNQLLIAFSVVSLEDAVRNALGNYFPHLETSNNARVQFYDKFQREADDHDRDIVKKYNADFKDTTLIFVCLSIFVVVLILIFWRNRLVYSPRSHPLSSSPSRRNSNQITTNRTITFSRLSPTPQV